MRRQHRVRPRAADRQAAALQMPAGRAQHALRSAVIDRQLDVQAIDRKVADHALPIDIHRLLIALHPRIFRERKVKRRQRPVILLRRGKHGVRLRRIHGL